MIKAETTTSKEIEWLFGNLSCSARHSAFPDNRYKLSMIRVQGWNHMNTVRAHPLGSAMMPHS
jgi:hypothetical protein